MDNVKESRTSVKSSVHSELGPTYAAARSARGTHPEAMEVVKVDAKFREGVDWQHTLRVLIVSAAAQVQHLYYNLVL